MGLGKMASEYPISLVFITFPTHPIRTYAKKNCQTQTPRMMNHSLSAIYPTRADNEVTNTNERTIHICLDRFPIEPRETLYLFGTVSNPHKSCFCSNRFPIQTNPRFFQSGFQFGSVSNPDKTGICSDRFPMHTICSDWIPIRIGFQSRQTRDLFGSVCHADKPRMCSDCHHDRFWELLGSIGASLPT